MNYVYVLVRDKDKKVLGASDKRYNLYNWATRQPRQQLDGLFVERHAGMSGCSARFPLIDLLDNPNMIVRS